MPKGVVACWSDMMMGFFFVLYLYLNKQEEKENSKSKTLATAPSACKRGYRRRYSGSEELE